MSLVDGVSGATGTGRIDLRQVLRRYTRSFLFELLCSHDATLVSGASIIMLYSGTLL